MEAGIKKGRTPPEWYLNEPELPPSFQFYMRAFWDLNTERARGFDMGPIPWSRILGYACHSGLNSAMIDVFIQVIRRMDNAFLEWHENERKKKQPKGKKKGKR